MKKIECTKCKEEKPLTEDFFTPRSDTPHGFRRQCKDCRMNFLHNYRNDNRAMLREGVRRNYRKHKQKYVDRQKTFEGRIKINLRSRLRDALKGKTKSASTMVLLGCSVDYLRNYIASRFTGGMSWDNYGEWHIDHILPCASFDLTKEEDQRKCFHYTNLQPLWAEDNLRKGCRIQ